MSDPLEPAGAAFDINVWGPAEAAPHKPRYGDRAIVVPDRIGERGAPLASLGVYQLEIDRGLIGSRLLVEVRKRRRREVSAVVVEVLEASPEQVSPAFPHTADCGGCRLQELQYAAQLGLKRALAVRQLAPLWKRLPGGDPAWVPAVEPAPRPFQYRNKMEFTFGRRRWIERDDDGRATDFALGLHSRGTWSKVLDVQRCALAFEGADQLLASVRSLALEHGLSAYDFSDRSGFLRHLLLRRGEATGELLVDLVTREEDQPGFEGFCRDLLAAHPEITTLVQNIHARPAMVSHGDQERVLHGPGHVHELLGGRRFRISANSFFQTNTSAAEALVHTVRERLLPRLQALRAEAVPLSLLDLYCGGGTFALSLAELFDAVLGLELVASAVLDARQNAELNGLAGVAFAEGDVRLLLEPGQAPTGLDGHPALIAPTVVLVDPPRAGLHGDVVLALLRARPRYLAYVACNLGSAARDLGPFLDAGYRILEHALFDLFPHTPHLEGFFLLEREPIAF